MENVSRWLIGLILIAGVIGTAGCRIVVFSLNQGLQYWRRKNKMAMNAQAPWSSVPRWLSATTMGIAERLFFATAIGVGLSGTAISMVAWTALKGAAYWNAFDEDHKANVFVGLVGSLTSMLFAILAGQICNGELWHYFKSLCQ